MNIKFLAVSDTHLGEDCSLLSFPHGRQHLWRELQRAFRLYIARISHGESLNTNQDACPCPNVPEPIDPLGEDVCLANLAHV